MKSSRLTAEIDLRTGAVCYKSKDGTIETVCIKGKALLEIGADPEKVMPEYTYVMSLLDLPERGGKGLEAVKV